MQILILWCFAVIIVAIEGQTTQASGYFCPINNLTLRIEVSTLDHSARRSFSGCVLPTCNVQSGNNCRESITPCFNYRTATNISYCAPGGLCSLLASCNSTGACSSNNAVCVVNSCCSSAAVCLPLYWVSLCQSLTSCQGFTQTTAEGANSPSDAVTLGDFNNDGNLDLALVTYSEDSMTVLLGDGTGAFGNVTIYSTGNDSQPSGLTTGDLNKDGFLDIIIANPGNNNLGLFFGYGDGKFRNQTILSTDNDSYPIAVIVGDVNKDQNKDLIVANLGGDNVGVFFGNENGLFQSQLTLSTGAGSEPYALALGDFNNDSNPDIAVANSGASNIGIFLGDGNGNFTAQGTFTTGNLSYTIGIVVGDYNSDNKLDLAVVNAEKSTVGIFFGDGRGNFSNQTTFSTGSGSYPITITSNDFNRDGNIDLAVSDLVESAVKVFFGDGNGNFRNQLTLSTGSDAAPYFTATGDINNDGLPDLAVSNDAETNVDIFLNACI